MVAGKVKRKRKRTSDNDVHNEASGKAAKVSQEKSLVVKQRRESEDDVKKSKSIKKITRPDGNKKKPKLVRKFLNICMILLYSCYEFLNMCFFT